MNKPLLLLLLMLLIITPVFSGTTGKIAGKVTDAENGAPLPGANVIIEGTTMGAAANFRGEFIILNVPPGSYTLKASMMGFNVVNLTDVRVMIDLTSNVDFQLKSLVLDMGEEVTIVAERPLIHKDITSSRAIIGTEEIAEMPVENFHQVLELQAGVVKGSGGEIHIRGGRSGEIAYLVDGLSVTD
ncbi:MAG: TonB-dependent receptor, partial [bacterium]